MSLRLYLGDSVVVSDTITTNGEPVDLTGAEVVLSLATSGDATLGGPATIDDPTTGRVFFTGGLATAAGTFGGRWIVTADGVITSYPAPTVRVVDPACQWANPADVAASAGAEAASDNDAVLAAIDAAQALLGAYFCTPVECPPVPEPVRWATASIASQLLTRPTPGSQAVVAETIGDYSYRLAAPTQVEVAELVRGVRGMVWPWLCGWARSSGTIISPRVWPPDGGCPTCGQWAMALVGGCGCGEDEYQRDAEGLWRS